MQWPKSRSPPPPPSRGSVAASSSHRIPARRLTAPTMGTVDRNSPPAPSGPPPLLLLAASTASTTSSSSSFSSSSSAPSALHCHIASISTYLGPTRADRLSRRLVLEQLTTVIHLLWPEVEVHVIGSCATDLYLPDSDIDLVVRNDHRHAPLTLPELHTLGAVLQPLSSSLNIIATAAVPLIKMTHAESGFTVDITLNVDTGLYSTRLVLDYLDHYSVLRPLAIVIKQMLKARGLNDLYTGGLPSYTLILMIVSFLQLYRPVRQHREQAPADDRERQARRQSRERRESEEDSGKSGEESKESRDGGEADELHSAHDREDGGRHLKPPASPASSSSSSSSSLSSSTGAGTSGSHLAPSSPLSPSSPPTPTAALTADLGLYLLSFFHLYGVAFDYCSFGISVRHPPCYFLKRDRHWLHAHNPALLCVENPLDPSIDLGFKVFKIREIVDSFSAAYTMLSRRMGLEGVTVLQLDAGHGGEGSSSAWRLGRPADGKEDRERDREEAKETAAGGASAAAATAGAVVASPLSNGVTVFPSDSYASPVLFHSHASPAVIRSPSPQQLPQAMDQLRIASAPSHIVSPPPAPVAALASCVQRSPLRTSTSSPTSPLLHYSPASPYTQPAASTSPFYYHVAPPAVYTQPLCTQPCCFPQQGAAAVAAGPPPSAPPGLPHHVIAYDRHGQMLYIPASLLALPLSTLQPAAAAAVNGRITPPPPPQPHSAASSQPVHRRTGGQHRRQSSGGAAASRQRHPAAAAGGSGSGGGVGAKAGGQQMLLQVASHAADELRVKAGGSAMNGRGRRTRAEGSM